VFGQVWDTHTSFRSSLSESDTSNHHTEIGATKKPKGWNKNPSCGITGIFFVAPPEKNNLESMASKHLVKVMANSRVKIQF